MEGLKTEVEALLYRLGGRDGDGGEDGDGDAKMDKGINNLVINFDENLGREKTGKKMVRYQENPRAEWGPMRRAGGGTIGT